MKKQARGASYSDAGVDIARGDEAVERLKKHVEGTYTQDVLGGVGWYAGALRAGAVKSMRDPVLLATMDGVGTKTIIAAELGQWEGIGHDIVNHCANDLVCQGGAPLLFLDYIAASRLAPAVIAEIVKGMSEACRTLGCILIGGETAEMPKVYAEGAHDVVGTMIGVAEREEIITGAGTKAGDILIALPSSGLHTNGYSLARKVLLSDAKLDLRKKVPPLDCTLGEALLRPHAEYSRLVRKLHEEIGLRGVAHITGSGIPGNLPRVLPEGLGARIERKAIRVLPIFRLIQEKGKIADKDMDDAFNMGVGMILVVAPEKRDAVLRETEGSYVIGEVVRGERVQCA